MVRILISISGWLLRFLLPSINQNAEKLVLLLTFKFLAPGSCIQQKQSSFVANICLIKSDHCNYLSDIFSILSLHYPLLRVRAVLPAELLFEAWKLELQPGPGGGGQGDPAVPG